LHALPVAALTIPAYSAVRPNNAKSAKHIVDSHVFFQHTHICITNANACLKAICSKK